MKLRFTSLTLALFLTVSAFPAFSHQQDDRARIDESRIPAQANDVKDFVPPGWRIEEQVTGDLNKDSLSDFALKLVEDKPEKNADDDTPAERQRALIVLLKNNAGKLSRAAVAGRLLQCTTCGGAFYGVAESPANVSIEKGVLIVNQDHGSRNITVTTYRFRYEPATGKFALIGFDYVDSDRLTGEVVSESTNYLTGIRITTREKNNKSRTSRVRLQKEKIYLEQVENENFEIVAAERLRL